MLTFLLAHENWPFTFAFAFVIALGLFELLAVLLGLSLLNTIDDILPTHTESSASKNILHLILRWVYLGKLPLLIWLILTFGSFSVLGFIINHLSINWVHHYQPLWTVVSIAFALTIFTCHFTGRWLSSMLPIKTMDTVNRDDLAGSIGTIVVGTATYDTPAKALVKDAFLQKYYVNVIPDSPKESLTQGTPIILLCRKDKLWLAARYQQRQRNLSSCR